MSKNKQNHNLDKVGDLRGKSAEAWTETLWEELLMKFASLKIGDLRQALENLISLDEKKMILRRIAVAVLLRNGKSYREIGNILWVSPSNISAIRKNMINAGHYKSQRSFKMVRKDNRGKNKEKSWFENFFDEFDGIDLWELIKNPPRPQGTGLLRAARNK